MLHSNLLGRLGNGLLKFVVLVVMVCNMSGAFAETISTNTTLSSAKTYSGDVTVKQGVTLTITTTDTVKINGNLINNGGTIVVNGGILIVNRNVTNTSVSKSKVTTTETTFDPSTAAGNPQKNDHKFIVETSINYDLGTISLTNGGQVNVNGNFTNNSAEVTVTTQASDAISRISVKGNFINSTPSVTGEKRIQETRYTWSKSWGKYDWRDARESNKTEPLTSKITLTNGYLLVDGNMELQDNSTVTFAGTGIGEDIESTIRVRKKKDGSGGNMTQSANAVISLASGAKGTIVIENRITDKTTSDSKHPWTISDEGELTVNSGFSLYVSTYQSDKLNALIDESLSDKTIDELQERLDLIDDVDIEEYLQVTYPDEYAEYLASGSSKAFSKYLKDKGTSVVGGFLEGLASFFVGYDAYGQFKKAVQQAMNEEIENLETTISIKELIEKGIQAAFIARQSEGISTLLPIELISFTATATEYGYTFNWVTASEVENDYFTLEYSINGVDFNEIDYVHGAGTTSETSEYEYRWDEAPEFDVVYFRLKQTDYNGEYSYSDVIVASRKKSSGANGTFRYGPLNLQIQDGELRYIQK